MTDPKFQVGDRVRVRRNKKAVGTVEHVTEWCPGGSIYKVRYGKRTCRCYYEDEIEPAKEAPDAV